MTVPLLDCTQMSAAQLLRRPRIEPERDGEAWFVILGEHGWLHGDREQALHEFAALERIEREGHS